MIQKREDSMNIRKEYMQEKFRPQFHYTAQRDQINDPNGLIYANGIYHMYHQYNIFGAVHWGHATSRDLLHWRHEENALQPDRLDQIWSGTCVMDTWNTAGFGKNAFVAAFTYGGLQAQGIAYSTDGGYQWNMYQENPVLDGNGKKDFRDPKIFRYQKNGEEKWIMILAAGSCLEFYDSNDLKSWSYLSKWGEEDIPGVIFECPDMFPIYQEDTKVLKWVLLASVMGEGVRNYGHGVVYAVGEFDGKQFINEMKERQYLDWGMDYYAVQTFYQEEENPGEGRRIALAWQDNWAYREITPTSPFNGQMNLLREITLYKAEGDWRLRVRPVNEYRKLREGEVKQKADGSFVFPNGTGELSVFCNDVKESGDIFGFVLQQGGECVARLEADLQNHVVRLYRMKSSLVQSEFYECCSTASCTGEQLAQLEIFIDKSSLEIMFGDGELWMSHLIFPKEEEIQLHFFTDPKNIKAWNIASIWTDPPQINTEINEWQVISGRWAQTRNGLSGSDTCVSDNTQPISSPALALAEAADWREFSADISIASVSETSMTSVLGEKAAGLAMGMDEKGSSGIIALVDFSDLKFIVFYNKEGKLQKFQEISITGGRRKSYHIKMQRNDDGVKICLDGKSVSFIGGEENGDRVGLVVLDALGYFNHISVKTVT